MVFAICGLVMMAKIRTFVGKKNSKLLKRKQLLKP